LLLRSFEDRDVGRFVEINADPRVMEYMPAILTQAESHAMVMRIRQHAEEKGYGIFAVELRGELIGFAGLSTPTFDAHFTPCIEVGWRLAAEHWGYGYATEAARAALDLGFERVGLQQIVSFTVPQNQRSRRVMEKIGMHRDPREDFDHPRLPAGHPLRRHVLYRIDRDEFAAMKAR
jgi:RimJ/RimL family protein N-acetyltransferase